LGSKRIIFQRRSLFTLTIVCVFLSSTFYTFIPLDTMAADMPRSADQGPWGSNFTVGSLGLDTNSPSVVISNGTLHSVFVNSGVYYSRSLDSGKTYRTLERPGPGHLVFLPTNPKYLLFGTKNQAGSRPTRYTTLKATILVSLLPRPFYLLA
jgi:hypothetical protein